MKSALLISCTAVFAWSAVPASAACTPPYKPVIIQGNTVCALDVSPTNSLKVRTKTQHVQAPRRIKLN